MSNKHVSSAGERIEERNTKKCHPYIEAMLAEPEVSTSKQKGRVKRAQLSWEPKDVSPELDGIVVRGARQHNLKNIDVVIPRNKLVVLTGVSGSGKSSLAFDTIYAEGQRRYVESLSPFVRRFLEQTERPKVDSISGLPPAVAIEQKMVSNNPRSTVGTLTEIINYLRVLYSRIGTVHCTECDSEVKARTSSEIARRLATLPVGAHFRLLAPVVYQRKGVHGEVIEQALQQGYTHASVNGGPDVAIAKMQLEEDKVHTIELDVEHFEVPSGKDEAWREHVLASVRQTLQLGGGLLTIDFGEGHRTVLGVRKVCGYCGTVFPELTSSHFSPNSPFGMCRECNGMGITLEVDPELIVVDPTISIMDGAIRFYGNLRKSKSAPTHILVSIADHYGVDLETPWQDLPQRFRHVILHGSGDEEVHHNISIAGWSYEATEPIPGVISEINRLFRKAASESAKRRYTAYMSQRPCSACQGTGLCEEARAVTLGDKTINDVGEMAIDQLIGWLGSLYATLDDEALEIAEEALKEVEQRLQFLLSVGLSYLTLRRSAPTLSSGEGQRIRLATQLSSGLIGVLYVLDEPSIGLHARDQQRLLDALRRLRDIGNTVLVVEHDEATMHSADWLIDLGPGAGALGGEVIAEGTPKEIAANPRSLTGRYLSGKLPVTSPSGRRSPTDAWLEIVGVSLHNLKQIDVRFPIGLLTCITGVSGSGKSSLVNETLYPALKQVLHRGKDPAGPHEHIEGIEQLNKVINITQDPIGRTPRSNPATYVGLFDEIRAIFAETEMAKERSYKASRFSFNTKGGRCENCEGLGQKQVEMHFLPDVWVTCRECEGTRYNSETLEIRYKGKNITEVLDMDVEEALAFFADRPKLVRRLQTLQDVGMGYVKLGQSATTLSGGEAQRVKLAKELGRPGTGRTLYILDEPTTGLHFADIQRLLDVLHRLVDTGNTMVVIEHNLDVIKTADWIVDLGPEGGNKGGYIVAQGRPEEVAQVAESYTGQFLERML